MSNITGFSLPKAVVEAATEPKIYNLSVPLANTEVSQLLTNGTKQIIVRVRGVAKAQMAFVATESSTKYLTIFPGTNLALSDLSLSAKTIYIQCNKASQVVEILEWS